MGLRKRLMMLYLLLILEIIQYIIIWLCLHILIVTHYFLIRRTLIIILLTWMMSHVAQKIIIRNLITRIKFNWLHRLSSKIKKIILLCLYPFGQTIKVKRLSLSGLFSITNNMQWFKRLFIDNILSYINS